MDNDLCNSLLRRFNDGSIEMMKISSKDLNTLRYWAQVGIGAKAHEYEKKYPKREGPHEKVCRIVHKVYMTQDAGPYRCS